MTFDVYEVSEEFKNKTKEFHKKHRENIYNKWIKACQLRDKYHLKAKKLEENLAYIDLLNSSETES